jgi:peptidoglycan L-alanyl-D-glutamate endopeptidase CwlK
MHSPASLWLFSALVGLILGLGWIARRFFYAPLAESSVPARNAPSPPVGRGRGRLRAKLAAPFGRPSVRWLSLVMLIVGGMAAFSAGLAGRLQSAVPSSDAEALRLPFRSDAEVLVSPPFLPPSSFVSDARPTLATADRDWGRLEPRFARAVLDIAAKMERRGYPVVLIEGYRSPERQDLLADSEQRLTQARGFQSRHQFGLAADLAPLRDGRIILSERDPWAWQAYQALGEEVEAAGLVWGGRWSLRDYGHVESANRPLTTGG